MPDFNALSLHLVLVIFFVSGVVVLVCGINLTRIADRFADITGIGEALVGAVFLGALTSLSGSVTSITAAAGGHPELAAANAIGGIAAQTFFLVIADFLYRRANLEHAAASLPNLVSGTSLIILLGLLVIAEVLPAWSWLGVSPMTPVLFIVYIVALRVGANVQRNPHWYPEQTDETRPDHPDEPRGGRRAVGVMLATLCGLGALTATAGYLIAATGLAIADATGLSESIVGALMTAVITSTPELVTTLAAVRRGAFTLAIGGIVGGNTFDVLFMAFSDVAYRPGSIYHVMGDEQIFLSLLSILMTATLLIGLLRRERSGPANIGGESVALLLLYLFGVVLLVQGFD